MKKNLKCSLNQCKSELVFKNANVVNVFTKTISVTDVAVNNGIIVGVNNIYHGIKEIDCEGKYLIPGLIDPHIHICSTLSTPKNFMNIMNEHGTTTTVSDPHEIVNVYGKKGLEFFLKDAKLANGNMYFALPSCVPASNYEKPNVIFRAKDLSQYIDLPEVIALGEVMSVNDVITGQKEIWDKINLFQKYHKILDGHSPLLTKYPLQAYRLAGISTDHEATYY
jgi:adenine deaminase